MTFHMIITDVFISCCEVVLHVNVTKCNIWTIIQMFVLRYSKEIR